MALESNQKFYDAFNENDLDLMSKAWLNDPGSQCIHPGWDVLNGFEPIIESWRRIFSAAQDLEIKLSHVEVVVSEDLAWIACQENLEACVKAFWRRYPNMKPKGDEAKAQEHFKRLIQKFPDTPAATDAKAKLDN